MTSDIHSIAKTPAFAQTPLQTLSEFFRHDHFEFPRDAALREELECAVEQFFIRLDPNKPHGAGNRDEQDTVVLVGSTGAGKSKTASHALAAIDEKFVAPDGRPLRYVSVKLASPFSSKEAARSILRAMSVTINSKLSEIELWEAIPAQFEAQGVVLLHLDEFQRYRTVKVLGKANLEVEAERLSATLNNLLMHPRWPVALLISGTEAVLPFWRSKHLDQVHRRTKFVVLEQMTPAYFTTIESVVERYARKAQLSMAIAAPDLGGRLALAAGYTLGIAIEIAQEAVLSAVRAAHSDLTLEDFGKVFARRNGVGRDENPFLAEDWTSIPVREKPSLTDA